MPHSRVRTFGSIVLVLAMAGTVLSVAGCSSSSDSPRGGKLEGKAWLLTSYLSKGTLKTIPQYAYAEALFKEQTIAGKCLNSYTGPFETNDKGEVTKVGPLTSTKMAGPDDVMAFESDYFALLDQSKSYYATSDKLTIYDKDDAEILVYKVSDAALTGDWRVTSYNNGKQAVVSVLSSTVITLLFGADGKVSGNGGINDYNGEYTTEGTDSITIGPLASGKMAGPEDAMQQEAAYLAALQSAKKIKVGARDLELRTADGALAVQAERTQ